MAEPELERLPTPPPALPPAPPVQKIRAIEVIGAGGTPEEAASAAYDACGSACDNY